MLSKFVPVRHICDSTVVSLMRWTLWQCDCLSDMFAFVTVSLIYLRVVAVWLCVGRIHCTLYVWLCGCQSDMLGFGGHVAVSLICWALVAVWLSV